jgi:aspartyl-tRNA(Asn)/glutamyl-tRNA(Gln) amidotransferase subunit A
LNPEIKAMVEKAAKELEAQGAIIKEVSLPHTEYAIAVYYLTAPAEVSSNLGRFDGVRFGLRAAGSDVAEMTTNSRTLGFGEEVKRRAMLGTYALRSGYYDAYYLQALKARRLIQNDFVEAFKEVDVILAPTTPQAAFKKGEKIADPLSMYLEDVCTVPVNLAGLPGISLPCGLVNGLPVGLQMIGRPMEEALLLQVAYAYEQSQEFYKLRPEWKGGKV